MNNGIVEHRIASDGAALREGGACSFDDEAGIIRGRIPYGIWSIVQRTVGGVRFREIIEPNAFADSIANSQIRFYVNHVEHLILAYNRARPKPTMLVTNANDAWSFEASVAPTTLGRDTLISMRRGDIDGSLSWGFIVPEKGDLIRMNNGMLERRVVRGELTEITLSTARNAYLGASASIRNVLTGGAMDCANRVRRHRLNGMRIQLQEQHR